MADETLAPPDLVAAGGAQATQDTEGMIDALRSRGTMPAGLMEAMQPPQPGFGRLLAESVVGGLNPAAPNPLRDARVTQHLQTQRQAMGMMEEQRRAQADQQRRAEHIEQIKAQKQSRDLASDKATMEFLAPLQTNKDPLVRRSYWQQSAPLLKKYGVDVSAFVGPLTHQEPSKVDIARVVGFDDANTPPDEIARFTGLDPSVITPLLKMSDAVRTVMGIPTKAANEIQRAKADKESFDLLRDEWGLSEKNPQTPFVLGYTQTHFGVPFSKATPDQRKEALSKAAVLAVKTEKATPAVRNAMAEFNPHGSLDNPVDVQVAMNQKRAKVYANQFNLTVLGGQIGQVGKAYGAELGRMTQSIDRLGQLDALIGDMDRLVAEGKQLGLTNNPQAINAIQQEIAHLSGRPGSKAAEWYRAFDTLNARFATVAQSVEQITGNRLAVTQTTRALGFHPKQSDPYTVQERIVNELRAASKTQRALISANLSRSQQQYEAAAAHAGVPFILGGRAVDAQEED